jgi:hypothetical protein
VETHDTSGTWWRCAANESKAQRRLQQAADAVVQRP